MPFLIALTAFSVLSVAFAGPFFFGRELGALEFFLYVISSLVALFSILFWVLSSVTRKRAPFLIVSVCIFLLFGLLGFVASTETDSVEKESAERQRIQIETDMFRLDPFAYERKRGK